MKVTITISCDNAAFGEEPELEVARILKDLSDDFELSTDVVADFAHDPVLLDINGNNVGSVKVEK